MLINLLKETLSFQQLDMMDESWLMTHIFSRTSFVASSVGERVYGAQNKVEEEMRRIERLEAAEWSYNDLLMLMKYGRGRGGKRLGVEWSLPDYGGKAGKEGRDRARYGYIVDGPNPAPYQPENASTSSEDGAARKRSKLDPEAALLGWESKFIAASAPSSNRSAKSNRNGEEDAAEEEVDKEDPQTLILTSERFRMLEHLFNPSALGLDQKALPELILDSISHISTTVSPAVADMMWSNIVLIGGLANAPNLHRRLVNELRPLAPADVPVRIWPNVAASRREDASLVAIKAGVAFACAVSAKEAIRRESQTAEGGAKGGRAKKAKGRASRAGPEDKEETGRDREGERWLTYAQWVAGGSSDADVIKAANRAFYAPIAKTKE